jgi:hypothetical protein
MTRIFLATLTLKHFCKKNREKKRTNFTRIIVVENYCYLMLFDHQSKRRRKSYEYIPLIQHTVFVFSSFCGFSQIAIIPSCEDVRK